MTTEISWVEVELVAVIMWLSRCLKERRGFETKVRCKVRVMDVRLLLEELVCQW